MILLKQIFLVRIYQTDFDHTNSKWEWINISPIFIFIVTAYIGINLFLYCDIKYIQQEDTEREEENRK